MQWQVVQQVPGYCETPAALILVVFSGETLSAYIAEHMVWQLPRLVAQYLYLLEVSGEYAELVNHEVLAELVLGWLVLLVWLVVVA